MAEPNPTATPATEPKPETTAATTEPTTTASAEPTTTADTKATADKPNVLQRFGQAENGITLTVKGIDKPITTFNFAKGGPQNVTLYGYDPDTDAFIYTCPRTKGNERWYANAPTKVAGIRKRYSTIDTAVKAANATGVRPISLQGISTALGLTEDQKADLKKGKLELTQEQFAKLQTMYGQMHILEAGKPAVKKPKGKTPAAVEPAQTPTVAQTEVDAAKAEQKSGWDKFCDHMKEHWWKYLLALITIGVIGYFGFRKGGWWNKKSKSTPSVTPSVPGIGDLGGNDSGKEDSKATGLSSLTQGALLGMTKVDGSKTGTDGEIIGLGGIGNRRS